MVLLKQLAGTSLLAHSKSSLLLRPLHSGTTLVLKLPASFELMAFCVMISVCVNM